MGLMFVPDKAAVLSEMHRTLAPGGRAIINTPGRIQPPFAAMEQAIVDTLGPHLGAFVAVVFSMHDPDLLASLLAAAGFAEVEATGYTAPLSLPGPAEFLWTYVNLTPMGALVADAPTSARDELERRVVESWEPYVTDGRTPVDQPMVLATARRR
jgi:SAM-dependent methyltransferase